VRGLALTDDICSAVLATAAGSTGYRVPVVTLAEDLYLLGSDAASGRLLVDPVHLDLGLGGALLLDLAMRERVTLVDEHVILTREGPTGEPLLDTALAEIVRAPRGHDPDHWVRHLGHAAHRTVQRRLVDLGVLRREDDRILRVIPVHRTRETDGRLHHELVDHLHDAVVLDHPPSAETAALAALALALGLDRHLFPRADRRAVTERMAEVAATCPEAAWVATAVRSAVVGVDAAMGIVPGPATY
jgi:Golgi phosphoprotein 3 (GPP34)